MAVRLLLEQAALEGYSPQYSSVLCVHKVIQMLRF